MKRLKLDRIWWLVTPGNPLKDTSGLASLDERVAAARRLARHPRIDVTGIEAEIGARYSHDTIRYLLAHCPGVHFVWIMGADNLRSFHRWQKWRRIAALLPIAVIDRLGPSLYAPGSVAAQALARQRIRGKRRGDARDAPPGRLDLSAWPEVAALVDGIARDAPCPGQDRRIGCELRPVTKAEISYAPG